MEGIDLLDSSEFDVRGKELLEKQRQRVAEDGFLDPFYDVTCFGDTNLTDYCLRGADFAKIVDALFKGGVPLHRARERAAVIVADGTYAAECRGQSPRMIMCADRSGDPRWSFAIPLKTRDADGKIKLSYMREEDLFHAAGNRMRGKIAYLEWLSAQRFFPEKNAEPSFDRGDSSEIFGLTKEEIEQYGEGIERADGKFRRSIPSLLDELTEARRDARWDIQLPPRSLMETIYAFYGETARISPKVRLFSQLFLEAETSNFYRRNARLLAFEVWRRERELGVNTRLLRGKTFTERIRYILDSDPLFHFCSPKEKSDSQTRILEERYILLSRIDAFLEQNPFLRYLLRAAESFSEKRKIIREHLKKEKFPESVLLFVNLAKVR